jgi:hypothetical protein
MQTFTDHSTEEQDNVGYDQSESACYQNKMVGQFDFPFFPYKMQLCQPLLEDAIVRW